MSFFLMYFNLINVIAIKIFNAINVIAIFNVSNM